MARARVIAGEIQPEPHSIYGNEITAPDYFSTKGITAHDFRGRLGGLVEMMDAIGYVVIVRRMDNNPEGLYCTVHPDKIP